MVCGGGSRRPDPTPRGPRVRSTARERTRRPALRLPHAKTGPGRLATPARTQRAKEVSNSNSNPHDNHRGPLPRGPPAPQPGRQHNRPNTTIDRKAFMFSRLKLLLTAAIALMALAAAVGSAQATNSFSITPGGNISSTSLGKLTFASSVANIACEVTMRGTLSSGGLIVLVELLLMGAITEVSIDNAAETAEHPSGCKNGRVLAPVLMLPWRVVFRALKSASGSIENLLGRATRAKLIEIRETQFKLEIAGIQCLFQGNAEGEIALIEETRGIEAHHTSFTTGLARATEAKEIPKHEGSIFCPSNGRFRGNLSIVPKQTITKLIP
jgi:hypothetical protein